MSTAAAVLSLAAPAAAFGNDAYEPNESPYQTFGPITSGQVYSALIDGPGDDDFFLLRGSGQVTLDATVTRDTCADGAPALTISFKAQDSYAAEQSYIPQQGSTQQTYTLEAGRNYVVGFGTSSPNYYDPACADGDVDYNFKFTGALEGPPSGGGDTGGSGGDTGGGGGDTGGGGGDTGGGGSTGGGGTTTGPRRLSSRPAFRGYACLYRSSGYTGFADPPFKFTLKRKGVWIDRSTAARPKGKWKWRNRKLTLYTQRGSKLHTFAHFRDSSGKYLRQHPVPRNNNPLICR